MKRLPAWIGWPGTGSAPGHDWLPGPKLRFTILLLTYAFLALALTVNYAYSVTFFLLAIIGTYVGLRRGFVNGLTRAEKLVMLVFAAYPIVAIISYLVGTQTNIGFRFLGRDLRFLLFVPIYLAIRWARPRREHVGWALLGAAISACVIAVLQQRPWPAPAPHGVAGTHITFGDLSLLSGFLAAVLLWPTSKPRSPLTRKAIFLAAPLALASGVGASVLADARGGWLAIPVLGTLILVTAPLARNIKVYTRISAVILFLGAIVGAGRLTPSVAPRIEQAYRDLIAYARVAGGLARRPCVDEKWFLGALLEHSDASRNGTAKVGRLSPSDSRQLGAFGCSGDFAITLRSDSDRDHPFEFRLYRGNGFPADAQWQTVAVLARGEGRFNLGWRGKWIFINSPGSWQRFSAGGTYRQTVAAFFQTRGNQQLLIVPLQGVASNFGYALASTSAGARLELWRGAWDLFGAHPWIGVGTGAFRTRVRDVLGSGPLVRLIGAYEHAHSDYLTSMSTNGSVGLLVYLLMLATPCLAFCMGATRTAVDVLRISRFILVAGVATFGLTESMFVHSFVISWYAVVVAILLGVTVSRACPSTATDHDHPARNKEKSV